MSSKIHIIGGPGCGKTTLARLLSAQLHIPHHELDLIGLKNGTNAAAYAEDVLAIAQQPAWITEGIYLLWTEPFLYHADYIVLLEVPWFVAAWRVIVRHISTSLRGTNKYPGLKLLYNFVLNTISYYRDKDDADSPLLQETLTYTQAHREIADPATREFIAQYTDKYSHLLHPPNAVFTFDYLQRYKDKIVIVKNKTDYQHLLKLLTKQ